MQDLPSGGSENISFRVWVKSVTRVTDGLRVNEMRVEKSLSADGIA
jgi:hypothetical protein